VAIEREALALPEGDAPLIVEGAGGVLVPVSGDTLYADLFAQWRLPVILVARTALGTINHSLLSLEALRARGIEVAGVIFSGDENAASEAAIVRFGQCRHLGRLPRLDPLSPAALADAVAQHIRVDLLA
jgi:dethiobiotin synthetase